MSDKGKKAASSHREDGEEREASGDDAGSGHSGGFMASLRQSWSRSLSFGSSASMERSPLERNAGQDEVQKVLAACARHKGKGNMHFKEKQYKKASASYTKALAQCDKGDAAMGMAPGNGTRRQRSEESLEHELEDDTSAIEETLRRERCILLSNRSASKLLERKPEEALIDAEAAIELRPGWFKVTDKASIS